MHGFNPDGPRPDIDDPREIVCDIVNVHELLPQL